jgi:hypothetical protein
VRADRAVVAEWESRGTAHARVCRLRSAGIPNRLNYCRRPDSPAPAVARPADAVVPAHQRVRARRARRVYLKRCSGLAEILGGCRGIHEPQSSRGNAIPRSSIY